MFRAHCLTEARGEQKKAIADRGAGWIVQVGAGDTWSKRTASVVKDEEERLRISYIICWEGERVEPPQGNRIVFASW